VGQLPEEAPAAPNTKDGGSEHYDRGSNQLRLWVESNPEIPQGEWYKEFGSFKVCGEGPYPKTFLLPGQPARGAQL